MSEEKIKRQKAKSKSFADFGVPAGSTLAFRKDPSITCKTVDDKNKVEYQGKVYPISGLAKELMKTPISGYHAFRYNGVLLAKLGEANTGVARLQTAPKPTETAQVAPQAPVSPTPITVPLPRSSEALGTPQKAAAASEDAEDHSLDPLVGTPAEENVAPLNLGNSAKAVSFAGDGFSS